MITIDFTDCDGDTLTHSLVQYTFEDEEHLVLLHPHGNSREFSLNNAEYPPEIEGAQDLMPKFAICEVSSSSGGLTSASTVGSLPRNRQQVANIRRRTGES